MDFLGKFWIFLENIDFPVFLHVLFFCVQQTDPPNYPFPNYPLLISHDTRSLAWPAGQPADQPASWLADRPATSCSITDSLQRCSKVQPWVVLISPWRPPKISCTLPTDDVHDALRRPRRLMCATRGGAHPPLVPAQRATHFAQRRNA